ncbi:MAG: hypothetical protein ACYCZF_04745 [Anaerolineae bacterium]
MPINSGDIEKTLSMKLHLGGKPIVIDCAPYGEMTFRGLTVGDTQYIESLRSEPNDREYIVALIHHQLKSPVVDSESIRAWTDDVMLKVAYEWTKQLEGLGLIPVESPTFTTIRKSIIECLNEWHIKMAEMMTKALTGPSQSIFEGLRASMANFAKENLVGITSLMKNMGPSPELLNSISTLLIPKNLLAEAIRIKETPIMPELQMPNALLGTNDDNMASGLVERMNRDFMEIKAKVKPEEEIIFIASLYNGQELIVTHLGYHNPSIVIIDGFYPGTEISATVFVHQNTVQITCLIHKKNSNSTRSIGFETEDPTV